MSVLSVSYDLYNGPGRAYNELIAAIKGAGTSWCHPVESTWYVETSLDPKAMYTRLQSHLHPYDKIIISPIVSTSWWSQGLPDDVMNWLHQRSGTWQRV